jgi:hypothetical protein
MDFQWPHLAWRRVRCVGGRVGVMRRVAQLAWAVLLLAGGGCASAPVVDNPTFLKLPGPTVEESNPVYVPLGKWSYFPVFEHAIDVLSEYGFEIFDSNRFSGQIETLPRIAPGLLLAAKAGSPSFSERLLATFQTYRHRVIVKIQEAQNGGYFIHVTVFKELEDLPRPVRSTAGAAAFRSDSTVERQFEVIDPTAFEANWIPKGRDVQLEQAILQALKYGR